MSSRIRLKIATTSIAVVAITVAGIAPASAQTDACRDLNDAWGVTDPEGLESAIQSAEDETGVDFNVVVVDFLEGSDDLEDAARESCPEVFESPGDVADGKVLIAVSVGDRLSAIDYGDDLNERLDDDAGDIRGRMNSFFQNGEIGAGLASGVGATVQGIDTVPANVGGAVAGGVAGTAAVVGGGAWLYTKRRTKAARSKDARTRFSEASTRVTNVQARWYDAEQEATIVGGRITGSAMARLDAAQIQAAEGSRALYEAWSPVSEVEADDVAKMNQADQAEVDSQVAGALAVVEEAETKTGALEAVVEELRGRPDALANQHRDATERIRSGLNAAEQRTKEGWQVDSGVDRLSELSAELDRLDPLALRIDVDVLGSKLDPIAAEVASVAGDIETLGERHADTISRRNSLGPDIEGQRGRALQLRSMISDWSTIHAADSFRDLLDHPAAAERQLSSAETSLAAAESVGEIPRVLSTMRMVNAELDKAQTAIDLADELLDEGDELDVLLGAAAEGASAAVAASADDAVLLINYVNDNLKDVPSGAPDVARRVDSVQEGAEGALRKNPPDYLLAMELSGQVESIVNTELGEFKTTVGERERVRNQALTEIRSASLALDRADRNVRAHMFSSRYEKSAQVAIDQLRAALNQAINSLPGNPKGAHGEATRIEQQANEIYREAQRRQRGRGGGFGGGFAGGIILGGGGFRGHGGGRRNRGGGWGGGGGGGFGGGFGGGSSGGWGGGGGGFGGGSSGGW